MSGVGRKLIPMTVSPSIISLQLADAITAEHRRRDVSPRFSRRFSRRARLWPLGTPVA
jgi:hypothetical protein